MPVNYELRTSRHAFRIVKEIATGGFGITYQAENLQEFVIPGTTQVIPAGALLAIKECFKRDIMVRNLRFDACPVRGCEREVRELRKQFLNEAFTIMRLQASHNADSRANAELLGFVPIFHAGKARTNSEIANVHYFVMPFLIGGSLKNKLGQMDAETTVWITYRLLQALKTLHNDLMQGPPTLHYDIKPANIMLTETGAPVLIDFGISSGTDNKGGTPDYTPHEQMRKERTGRYSDLYALGASLYELICGKKIPQYVHRPPYVGCDTYCPLKDEPGVVQKFQAYGIEYEKSYLQKMNKPYKGGHVHFATAFLTAIDVALRTECTGPYGRWPSATLWLDSVFQGLAPVRPSVSLISKETRLPSTQTVWIPSSSSSAILPIPSCKRPGCLEVVLYVLIGLVIIMILLLVWMLHSEFSY